MKPEKRTKGIYRFCGLRTAAAALALAAMLAGCGGTGEPTATVQETAAPSASGTASEAPAEETARIVHTEMGDVEVPADPQRVVVNWYVADVLDLGITPVAYSGWAQESMPFYEELSAVPVVENWEAEDILTYDPDLIITYDPQDFEKFSKLAPVVVVPEVKVKAADRLHFIAQATGREKEAEAIIAAFESKLAEAKEKIGATDELDGKTFSILEDWGRESYGIYFETGSRGGTVVYDYLNLSKPEKLEQLIADSGEGRGSLSYEVASDYFGDYVLWFLQEGKESEYAQTEIWKSIPAVQNGKVISIPGNYSGLFYYDDVVSMTAQLDYITGRLLEAAE